MTLNPELEVSPPHHAPVWSEYSELSRPWELLPALSLSRGVSCLLIMHRVHSANAPAGQTSRLVPPPRSRLHNKVHCNERLCSVGRVQGLCSGQRTHMYRWVTTHTGGSWGRKRGPKRLTRQLMEVISGPRLAIWIGGRGHTPR